MLDSFAFESDIGLTWPLSIFEAEWVDSHSDSEICSCVKLATDPSSISAGKDTASPPGFLASAGSVGSVERSIKSCGNGLCDDHFVPVLGTGSGSTGWFSVLFSPLSWISGNRSMLKSTSESSDGSDDLRSTEVSVASVGCDFSGSTVTTGTAGSWGIDLNGEYIGITLAVNCSIGGCICSVGGCLYSPCI
ncbi:hypothetical protein OGATHE_000024 [Ogataea polymorpha]|uniref:Uncharacterized protein n=1 Tax=Ogataea polymorpha TaxID=460523 RepID=A0A9P8THN5_9ASCO|nr:hypothetical protein OGATHE_000024 [Ogataea polymorpha]